VVTPSPGIAELAADVVSPVRRVRPPTESCGHTRHSQTIIRFVTPSHGEENVKSVGIREAKAHLSALARAAAKGEPTLLTDYGEPRAVITSIKSGAVGQVVGISDPSEFKQRLLALPYALEVNF
jgi:prevent-host-death family protein